MVAIKSMNKVWVVAAGLCAAAGSAGAFGVALTASPATGAQVTTITVQNTSPISVYTGMYKAATSGVGAPTGSPFDVFCIDPKTSGSASGSYSEVSLYSFLNTVTSSGPPARTGYQEQFTNPGYTGATNYSANSNTTEVLNNIVNLFSHAYIDANNPLQTVAARADKLTAFGYVLWEIMGEAVGGLGRSTGGLTETNSLSANVDTLIDNYISALTNGPTTWVSLGLGSNNDTFTYSVFYDSLAHTGQNFLRVTPSGSNGGITSIPEPGTIALAGLALLGTFRASRRKAVMA